MTHMTEVRVQVTRTVVQERTFTVVVEPGTSDNEIKRRALDQAANIDWSPSSSNYADYNADILEPI